MCPSIETLSGSPFVETIRIEKGRIHNLPYHNARMNRTRRSYSERGKKLISQVIFIRGSSRTYQMPGGIYPRGLKGRIRSLPYASGSFLAIGTCDEIDYSYKSTDRQCLNDLFAQRAGHDDILIIRDGLLTDTSICNVALWNGTSWITPARPLLCGTMRAYLLDKGLVQAGDIPGRGYA